MNYEIIARRDGEVVKTFTDPLLAVIFYALYNTQGSNIPDDKYDSVISMVFNMWINSEEEISLFNLCDFVGTNYSRLKDMNKWDQLDAFIWHTEDEIYDNDGDYIPFKE